MTIIISVKVNDGIVIAADSLGTIIYPDNSKEPQSYGGVEKVFQLFDGLPIAVTTSGIGRIEDVPVCSIGKKIAEEYPLNRDNYDIREIAEFFGDKFLGLLKGTEHTKYPEHKLEYRFFGYNPNSEKPDAWGISITPGGNTLVQNIYSGIEPGIVRWCGEGDSIARLVNGISRDDPRPVSYDIKNHVFEPLGDPTMPIKDAIDLTRFLADVACKFSHFSKGHTMVGGEIDIAVITRHEGFRWVSRKSLE